MKDEMKLFGGVAGTMISSAGITIADINEWVSLICSIIGILITILTCIVLPLIAKIKKATEDGKITGDEIEDINDALKQGIEETNKMLDNKTKKEKKKKWSHSKD